MTTDWTAVIPVKRLGAAKSRLRGAVPAARHRDLAVAMLCDTAAAVLACPEVTELVVVTDDRDAGLNDALRYGADTVAGPWRDRAVLTGDLPALRPDELGRALRGVRGRSFVPDAAGTGTVLLAAPAGVPLDPRFGVGSAAAHLGSGATPLHGDWPGLRQDVDTAADLRTVLALGAGPHTCALLRDLGVADCGSSRVSAA